MYSKSGKNLKFKLLLSLPSVILAVNKEKKIVSQLIEKENLKGIISDNRFGVYSNKLPSVVITHQLNVLSGKTTFLTSKIHQKIIEKFDECWVPDLETKENLSGKLGHLESHAFNLKYIGVLSRFNDQKLAIKYDLLVLLSGPEPQRSFLENKLLNELKNYNGSIFFVRGVLKNSSKMTAPSNVKIVDYLLTEDLQKIINQSEIVLARSGYSTIMDLAVLGKKAFFIPTPGQFEQQYLAEIVCDKLIAPFSNQQNFEMKNLMDVTKFSGFKAYQTAIDLDLFSLFQGK